MIKQVRSRAIQDRRQNVSEAHLRNKQSPCKTKILAGLPSCFAFTCQFFNAIPQRVKIFTARLRKHPLSIQLSWTSMTNHLASGVPKVLHTTSQIVCFPQKTGSFQATRAIGPILIRDLFEGLSDSRPPTFKNAQKGATRVVLPRSPKLKRAFRSIEVHNFSIPETHLRTGHCRATSPRASNRRIADWSFHLSP